MHNRIVFNPDENLTSIIFKAISSESRLVHYLINMNPFVSSYVVHSIDISGGRHFSPRNFRPKFEQIHHINYEKIYIAELFAHVHIDSILVL